MQEILIYVHMQAIVKRAGRRAKMASERKTQKSLCNCTALRKATRRVSQLYDSALEPCGLRTTQRSILMQIARAGTPSLGELAEALVMDRGALTHTLKPLERDRLVEIRVDPEDRRNRLVALTATGRKKLEESQALWTRAQQGFEAAFGVAKSAALRQALEFVVSEDFVAAFNRRG
jgi:DNA-binding MarR family transcriptional regulator